MKLTKSRLRRIIKEEASRMNEEITGIGQSNEALNMSDMLLDAEKVRPGVYKVYTRIGELELTDDDYTVVVRDKNYDKAEFYSVELLAKFLNAIR
jgi:hypothetical protein